MSKTSNQLAKTTGIVFNKADAERIASVVMTVEDGGRFSPGRQSGQVFGSPTVRLFTIETAVPCGTTQGIVSRWVKCDIDGGCGYKIEEVPGSESTNLVDLTMVFDKAAAAYKAGGGEGDPEIRYVEAKFVPAFDSDGIGDAGFWQITDAIYCNGCPTDDCIPDEGSGSGDGIRIRIRRRKRRRIRRRKRRRIRRWKR